MFAILVYVSITCSIFCFCCCRHHEKQKKKKKPLNILPKFSHLVLTTKLLLLAVQFLGAVALHLLLFDTNCNSQDEKITKHSNSKFFEKHCAARYILINYIPFFVFFFFDIFRLQTLLFPSMIGGRNTLSGKENKWNRAVQIEFGIN